MNRPILVDAKEAARLCSISETAWWRLDAAGKIPLGIHLGRSKRWRRAEIEEWICQRCPNRVAWGTEDR